MSAAKRNQESSSTLFVGAGRVEWIPKRSSEGKGYVRGICENQTPPELAQAAIELLESTGHKPGKCTLLLGGSMVRQRIVSLANLSEKETKAVLHRKAANILEVQLHQTAFTALEMEDQDRELDKRWLVSALRLDDLRALKRDLRSSGFQIQKIVFDRLILLEKAISLLPKGEDKSAGIVIGVESESVAISMVAEGKLVQQTVVPGHFQVNSTMAASVLQELRGFESHWRRQSRGGAVSHVVLSGLAQEEAEHFELASHAALPDSQMIRAGDGPQADREGARAEYLKFCSSGGTLAGTFTMPSPPRRPVLAAFATVALSFGIYLGNQAMQSLEGQRASISAQTEALRSQVQGVESVDRDLQIESTLQAELAIRKSDLQSIGSSGLDAEEWLSLAFGAFEQRALLDSVHIDDMGSTESFAVAGRVSSDPLVSVEALLALSDLCQAHPGISDFELHLPSAMNEGADTDTSMSFRVTATIGQLREGLNQ
ncbi:MAG: hypothetical protein ACI87O_000378 [Planctomycetota bacterium]|jgi:hypothetical protein